jgi:chloramphenicol 3-O phosphotransferase
MKYVSTIIILNGTSSAGKTTLSRALQQHFTNPFLLAGIDRYVFMLPPKYLNEPLWGEVFAYDYEKDRITAVHTGQLGHLLVSAMHHSVAAIAGSGFDVIVDHVILEQEWLPEMAVLFSSFTTYFIGIRCPLAVVEQRERDRKDRTLGQAAAQFHVVHAGKAYDFEVDTSLGTPDESAQAIINYMAQTAHPTALQRYRTQ